MQNIQFDAFLNTAPPTIVVLPDAPKFTIVTVSKSYLTITNTTLTELVGIGLLEAFPSNPHIDENGAVQLKESLITALTTKQETVLEARRYDIPVRGTNQWETRYWTASNSPILNEQGEVECIVHITQDVTTTYNLVQKKRNELDIVEAQRRQLQEAYQQAPLGIGLLTGRELKIEFGNDSIMHVLGKTKDIIGKTVAEAIP
ncbi:MAG: PAS domain-containing protein, partial [Bacteroidota bacterium]|nr:PAS domain-containing protein [Bacteroidota bacterium]